MVLNENRINSRSLDFRDVMLIPNVSDFRAEVFHVENGDVR